jgi:UDP-glucose 4-epimerase
VPYEQAYQQGFEDMMRRVPDLSKSGRFVGYRPTVSLDQILSDVIDYQGSKTAGHAPAAVGSPEAKPVA